MTPLQALTEQLDLVEAALDAAQDVYDDAPIEDGEDQELLSIAVRMHGLKDRYEELRSIINTDIITKVGWTSEPVTVGDRTVEISGSKPRKAWDHAAAKTAVVDRVIAQSVDMDTGEIMSVKDQILTALDAVGINYWKVGVLKSLGINAAHYCEEGESQTRLVVRKK